MERTGIISLLVSIIMHVAVIGGVAGLSNKIPADTAIFYKAQEIKTDKKKYAVLPEIKVLAKIKQLRQSQLADTPLNVQSKSTITLKAAKDDSASLTLQTDKEAEKAMMRYQDMVKQKIESQRSYPLNARFRKIEGVVELMFTIISQGHTKNIRIVHSSGSSLLDGQAVKTIQNASPFLPLPANTDYNSVDIRVTIVFSLD